MLNRLVEICHIFQKHYNSYFLEVKENRNLLSMEHDFMHSKDEIFKDASHGISTSI